MLYQRIFLQLMNNKRRFPKSDLRPTTILAQPISFIPIPSPQYLNHHIQNYVIFIHGRRSKPSDPRNKIQYILRQSRVRSAKQELQPPRESFQAKVYNFITTPVYFLTRRNKKKIEDNESLIPDIPLAREERPKDFVY
jgi:hypothetical protein